MSPLKHPETPSSSTFSLLQHDSFPWATFKSCSGLSPLHRLQSSRISSIQSVLSASSRPSHESLLQHRLFLTCRYFQKQPPTLAWLSPLSAGRYLLYSGVLHKLQRNLCSGTWTTTASPCTLILVSAELFLILFPLPITVLNTVLPCIYSLMCSALSCGGSAAEMAGIGWNQLHATRSALVPPHRGHLWSDPLPIYQRGYPMQNRIDTLPQSPKRNNPGLCINNLYPSL